MGRDSVMSGVVGQLPGRGGPLVKTGTAPGRAGPTPHPAKRGNHEAKGGRRPRRGGLEAWLIGRDVPRPGWRKSVLCE